MNFNNVWHTPAAASLPACPGQAAAAAARQPTHAESQQIPDGAGVQLREPSPQQNGQEVRHHLLPAGTFDEQAEQEAGDLPHPRHIGYLKKLSEKDMAGVKMMLEKVNTEGQYGHPMTKYMYLKWEKWLKGPNVM